jgi:D-3-phosphoglycerate dehydrogenase
VDIDYAAKHGIAVFNSPFANSRSVAELVIAEIIALARQLCDRSDEMHRGTWNKVSNRCWEVRGKTLGMCDLATIHYPFDFPCFCVFLNDMIHLSLHISVIYHSSSLMSTYWPNMMTGIVGYGHIGSQLSVLAEALGMTVIYYDVLNLMALGTAKQVPTLEALLAESDFVTLHVPELPETQNMISGEQFSLMKTGAYLINASRGSVVDIPSLISNIKTGKIGGVALDVYPNEPTASGDYFNCNLNTWAEELCGMKNVIITPHIGGSTEEAQRSIGVEVADSLVRYINQGITVGSVNMPEVNLRSLTLDEPDCARVCDILSTTSAYWF